MNSHSTPPPASPDEANQFEHLQKILSALEEIRGQDKLDLILAILLAITALASTWCAYQSQLWNGVQLVELTDAEIASQLANQRTLAASQRRTLDAIVLLQFLEALESDRTELADAIHRRMRSPMHEAVDAWLKLDPLHNLDVPPPDKMPEYVLVELDEAKKAHHQSTAKRVTAQKAGSQGDRYVLLALLFALVLFFGGMACTIRSPMLRHALAGIACVLFVVTMLWLVQMPLCPA